MGGGRRAGTRGGAGEREGVFKIAMRGTSLSFSPPTLSVCILVSQEAVFVHMLAFLNLFAVSVYWLSLLKSRSGLKGVADHA